MNDSGFQEVLKINTLNFYVITYFFLKGVKKKKIKSQIYSFQVMSFTYVFFHQQVFPVTGLGSIRACVVR